MSEFIFETKYPTNLIDTGNIPFSGQSYSLLAKLV